MAAAIGKNATMPPAPRPEEIRHALERILRSKHFAQAPKKQRFLQLICDAHLNGRVSELNEYMIGYEVFDREEGYNPALDPIVRVGAHELRKKLELYYQCEGKNDEILLDIPIGSYVPMFRRRDQPQAVEPSSALPHQVLPAPGRRIWNLILLVSLASLLVMVAMLAAYNRQLRLQIKRASEHTREIPAVYRGVWQPLLKDENPTLLVLSNPPVYRFWNPVDPDALSKRSVELTDSQAAALAEALGQERFAKDQTIRRVVLSYDEYTGLGEAIGLHLVTSLLNKISRSVVVKQSRTVSVEDLKNRDVILLGSAWVNEWSGKFRIEEDFSLGASATILNRNPRPEEAREYKVRFDEDTGRVTEDYALITVKPNISERNTVIVLAGTHSEGTEAAAEYVTSDDYLQTLNQRLAQMGANPPRHFQVLLKVAVDNGIPTTISIVAVHELHPD